MNEVLDDLSAASLAEAIEAKLFAYLRYLSSSPCHEDSPLTLSEIDPILSEERGL